MPNKNQNVCDVTHDLEAPPPVTNSLRPLPSSGALHTLWIALWRFKIPYLLSETKFEMMWHICLNLKQIYRCYFHESKFRFLHLWNIQIRVSSISGPHSKSGMQRPNIRPTEKKCSRNLLHFFKIHFPVFTIYISLLMKQ